MAGDWIKIEENLPDKPEVWQIAGFLKIEPDAVVGKLVRLWGWATKNCNGDGVTTVTVIPLLNRITGVTDFMDAIEKTGWVKIENDKLIFTNFTRHCSKTAKERALTERRVQKARAIRNGDSVTTVTVIPLQDRYNCNGHTVTKTLPEKRREEKNNNTGNSLPLKISNSQIGEGKEIKPYPTTILEVQEAAQKIGYAIGDEDSERFMAHYAATGWTQNGCKISDWTQKLVKWKLNRNEFKSSSKKTDNVLKGLTPDSEFQEGFS